MPTAVFDSQQIGDTGQGKPLGQVDYSAQDQSWLPTGGTVGEGATCVAFDFDTKTVLHGVYNGVSWDFTEVPVNYGDYYFCHDTLTSANQFSGQRSIIVWTGVEGQYFITFVVDKYLVLDGMHDQPISAMRDHIDENGIFMFHAVGCSWDFHGLSSLDFATLTPAVKHIYDTSLGRSLVIDPIGQTLYIEGLQAEGGMTYIIRADVAEFPDDTSFSIGGAAFVVAENFVGFKPEDFDALDPYIHFTRPFVRIDTFSEIYRDFNVTLLNGFRKQQEINDLQNDLLLEKVDDIRLENISIPVEMGRVNFPMFAPEGESINPKYVGHWPSLAALIAATTVTDYVDLNSEPQMDLGFFAFNSGTGKVAIPQLTSGSDPITGSQQIMSSKIQQAETGTRFTSLTFSQNAWSKIKYQYTNRGALDWSMGAYVWDQPISTNTSAGNLELGAMSHFAWDFGDPEGWEPVIVFHDEYILSGLDSENWANDWTHVWNSVTVTWTNATRTLTFSEPVGLSNIGYNLEWSFDDDQIWMYTLAGAMGGWEWADSSVPIGDPSYPRLLATTESKSGALSGERGTELIRDSHTLVQALPGVGAVTSNAVYLAMAAAQITSGASWNITHTNGTSLTRDGNHIYWFDGTNTTDITDASGNTLIYNFQIPAGNEVASVTGSPNGQLTECMIAIRYNVENLLTVLGNVDLLQTTAKNNVVAAINEIQAKLVTHGW